MNHLPNHIHQTNNFLVNSSLNLFLKKIRFSPVEYLKECRGRDLTSLKDFNIKFHNGGLLNEHKNFALSSDSRLSKFRCFCLRLK